MPSASARAAGHQLYLYLYSQAVDCAALHVPHRCFRAVAARSLRADADRARLDPRLTSIPGFWDLLASEVDRMERVCLSRAQKQQLQQQQQQEQRNTSAFVGWRAP